MLKTMYSLVFKQMLAVILAGLILAPGAIAQEDDDAFMLEEVTVTAEKREASLQKTAMSMAAVTGENIREQGLISVEDVLKDVPNVVIQGAAKGFAIAIRGLGSDLPPGIGESSVSTNFDGVYNYRSEAGTLGFYDLARVEVLRGPQGTLYGRNATGGVVNVISNAPNIGEFEGYGTVEIGNYSMLRTEGAVNVPVNDDAAARMAFVSVNRDGFFSNGMGDAVGSSAKTRVRYNPSEDVDMTVSGEFTKIGGKAVGFSTYSDFISGNPYYSSLSENLSQNYQSYKLSANVEFAAGPGVVTFIPSYQHAEGTHWSDRGTYLEKLLDPADAVQYSAELRYGSGPDADIKWVGGLYYYDLQNDSQGGNNPLLTSDMTTSYAAFGQVTVPLTDSLRAILGLRAAYDEKSYDNPNKTPCEGENNWTAFDWKAGLEADLADGILGYLTLASGHRPGGFNTMGEGDKFEPEALTSAEIGIKSRFMNQRIQVNANAFYYDYKDFQVMDFYVDMTTAPFFFAILENVGDVTNFGGELETELLLTRNTVANFAVTYLKSEFQDDYILHGGSADPPGTIENMKGKSLPHAPELTLKGSLEHSFVFADGDSLIPKIDVRWTDDQYVAPFPGEAQFQEAHAIYDVSLRYSPADKNWSVNAYMKNAGDEVVKTAAFGDSIMVNNPRLYGVVFSAKF
jgi:iron complex outermembrane receptor protein